MESKKAVVVNLLMLGLFLAFSEAHSGIKEIFKEVSQATNTFGVNLHRTKTQVSGGNTNTFFSPLSIYAALAMLNVAARGETAYQIQQALNWNIIAHPNDPLQPNAKMRKFMETALTTAEKNPVKFANKLWLQKYFCTQTCKTFTKILEKNYDSDLGVVNFASAPENARREINSWVSRKTNGKIKELMEDGSITSLTRFVLTNAIYFKSDWLNQFDKTASAPDDFYVSQNKKVRPIMMRLKGKMPYYQDSKNQVLEMPYKADNLSMVVMMPRNFKSIETLERDFSHALLTDYLGKLKKETVTVSMPKFTIESDIHLKDYLSLMGIKNMFDPFSADLSGATGYKGLFVTHAIHKAYIEVNEEGAEAAAASGISAGFRSLRFDEYYFTANHPFMFAIIHRPSSAILFHGEIVDPTQRVTSSHSK